MRVKILTMTSLSRGSLGWSSVADLAGRETGRLVLPANVANDGTRWIIASEALRRQQRLVQDATERIALSKCVYCTVPRPLGTDCINKCSG
jgi:hypothetical protein